MMMLCMAGFAEGFLYTPPGHFNGSRVDKGSLSIGI
jgi:hypothetical protein